MDGKRLALRLAGIGIYGMFAYGVPQRSQEIGVRIALGASPNHVLRQLLSEASRLAAAGAGAGLLLAIPITPLIRTQLFHVRPLDPVTVLCSILLVLIVSAGSAYVRARRATLSIH